MSTILEVKDLKKYFKVNAGLLHAVDGVSFKIEEGQTLGVVGESGCGKSTLGRVVLHLLDNTGGQILYHGEDVTTVRAKAFCIAPRNADYFSGPVFLAQSAHDGLSDHR